MVYSILIVVGESVSKGRINRFFADDLALFVCSEHDIPHALDRFSETSDRAGIKITT